MKWGLGRRVKAGGRGQGAGGRGVELQGLGDMVPDRGLQLRLELGNVVTGEGERGERHRLDG